MIANHYGIHCRIDKIFIHDIFWRNKIGGWNNMTRIIVLLRISSGRHTNENWRIMPLLIYNMRLPGACTWNIMISIQYFNSARNHVDILIIFPFIDRRGEKKWRINVLRLFAASTISGHRGIMEYAFRNLLCRNSIGINNKKFITINAVTGIHRKCRNTASTPNEAKWSTAENRYCA